MMDRLMGGNKAVNIEAGVHDNATDRLADIDGHAEQIDHMSVVVDTEANDDASGVIDGVSDAASSLDGTTATADLEANDGASGVIDDVSDTAASLDGTTVNIDITANDQASPVLSDVGGLVDAAKSAAGGAWGKVIAAAGFAGVSMGVGDAIQSFMNFEAGMSQVSAISGATGAQLDMLTAKAKEMGATTKFTATNAAEAFNYMAMAGWNTEQMLAGIEPVMNLAAASGLDLGRTSDIVTDALTAFGLKAEDTSMFADVLATASARSNTNVDMLGESFKYAAPVAGALGYSIQDTAIALGIMANSGIKGSMAGTTLRRALSNLASPSESVAAAMDKYNISLTDSQGNMKSLGELMDNIRDSLGGLDEAEQAAAASTLFGTQAMAGMLSIINATDSDYQSLTDSIYNAEGATSRMADTMLDNLQGSMYLLSSAAEAVQNTFGERVAPYLRSMVDGITAAMPELEGAINSVFDILESGKQRVEENLEIHFGTIELSEAEVETLAGTIVPVEGIIAELHVASASFAEGESLTQMAEAELKKIEPIHWMVQKADVDFSAVQGDLQTAAQNLKEDLLGAMKNNQAGAEEFVDALLPPDAASDINAKISSWFSEDSLQVESLASGVQNILQKAIEQGSMNLETSAAMSILQQKMMDLVNGAKRSELQGKLDWLSMTSSGAALSADSWRETVDYIGQLESELINQDAEVYQSFLGTLAQLEYNNPERAGEIQAIRDVIRSAHEQTTTTALLQGWIWMHQALSEAYSDELGLAAENMEKTTEDFGKTLEDQLQSLSNGTSDYGTFSTIMEGFASWSGGLTDKLTEGMSGETKKALADRFEAMLPTVDAMRTAIDNQLSDTGQVSSALMSAYREALTLGATAGNEGAADGLLAQMVADTFNGDMGAFEKALASAGMGVDDFSAMFGETFGDELTRAFAQTSPDVDYGGFVDNFIDAMSGEEIDWASVESMLNELGLSVKDKLEEKGIDIDGAKAEANGDVEVTLGDLASGLEGDPTQYAQGAVDNLMSAITDSGATAEMTVDGMKVTLGETVVDKESAAQSIADAAGMSLDSLGMVELENGNVELSIPTVSFADSMLESAVTEQFGNSLDSAVASLEANASDVQVDLSSGTLSVTIPEMDESGISNIADALGLDSGTLQGMFEQALESGGELTVEIPTSDITVQGGAEGLASALEEFHTSIDEAFSSETIEPEAEINPQTELGDADVSSAKSDFDSQAQDTFNTPAQVNATVDVVNVSLGAVSGLEAAYAAFAAQAQAAFSVPVSVTGTVNVTTSANVSGGAAQSAEGRFVDGPLLSWVGEDGPEYIIPVGDKRTSRGMELWMQAGEALGAFDEGGFPAFADGGYVGGSSPSPDYSGYISSGSGGGGGGASPEVIISMSPNFTVNSSGDGKETADEIRRMMLNMTDDIAAEMGRRLKEAYANMPR